MGLTVLGFEQSSVWGWSSPATWVCIIVGLLLMVVFVRFELSIKQPLLRLQIFLDRGFATDTVVLGLMSIVFVPFFFFGSVYAQVALGKNSSQAGEYILWFFIGFVIMAQVGGRMLDRRGARPAIVIGGALGAVGFFLLAGKLTDLSLGAQSLYIAIAGGGLGLMLGPASTDAVNRAPSTSYSEVTGITQTARNFGASLGLAVLGAILISRNDTNVTAALTKHGVPSGVAHRIAASFSGSGAASGSGSGRSAGAGPRRAARVRALDADRLLHHGRGDGRDVHRGGPLATARSAGVGRGPGGVRGRRGGPPGHGDPMSDDQPRDQGQPAVGRGHGRAPSRDPGGEGREAVRGDRPQRRGRTLPGSSCATPRW